MRRTMFVLASLFALGGCVQDARDAPFDSSAFAFRTADGGADGGACLPLNAVCRGSNECCTNRCRAVSLSESRCIEQALPDASCGAVGQWCHEGSACCSGRCLPPSDAAMQTCLP